MAPIKRKCYSAKFKLKTVQFAKKEGNRAAERKYGVCEKLVRDWRKQESLLKNMPKTKKANRSKPPRWPELEKEIASFVINQRLLGIGISTIQIRRKAMQLAKEMKICDFIGSANWCFRFMKRNHLSIRARTTMAQKLPPDFMAKINDFHEFVEKIVEQHSITPDHIINMDETPLSFDIPTTRTVNQKGEKSITIRTTGHEKSNFTVALACAADGSKIPPMVIFKKAKVPKEQFPNSVVVHANKKGWMDEEGFKIWVNQCYSRRQDGFFKSKKALLVMDSMRAHITDMSKNRIINSNTIPAIIPGGMTKILQPLDISVNRSFKSYIRDLWEQWMINGDHSFTKTDRMRRASYLEVVNWVDRAWKSVPSNIIISGFKKAKLIHPCDEDLTDNYPDDINETANKTKIPKAVMDAFHSDTEDENFEGFCEVLEDLTIDDECCDSDVS